MTDHTDPIEMFAPTGEEIRGTFETVLGVADVAFYAPDASEFEHTGNGTEMFWDTAETKMIDGKSVFTDASGCDWLEHHLIANAEKPHSDTVIALIQDEMRVGEKLMRAQALYALLKNDMSGDTAAVTRVQAEHIVRALTHRYADAKAATLAAISGSAN